MFLKPLSVSPLTGFGAPYGYTPAAAAAAPAYGEPTQRGPPVSVSVSLCWSVPLSLFVSLSLSLSGAVSPSLALSLSVAAYVYLSL